MSDESMIEVRITGPADARLNDLSILIAMPASDGTRLLDYLVAVHGGTAEQAARSRAMKVIAEMQIEELRFRRANASSRVRAVQEAATSAAEAVRPIRFTEVGG